MSLSKLTSNDTGFSKWHIALAIGGSLLAGAGLYYFLLKDDPSSSAIKKGSSQANGGSQPVTPDDETPEALEEMTPLERAQCLKNKGNKYFKGGKYDQAIKLYDEALEICPSEHTNDISTFYQNRAAAYEQLKNWENVMRDCTAALELNNKYVKALNRRAKACEVLNDLVQALEDLTAACIIESFTNEASLVGVDRILKELGKQHAKEAMEVRQPIMPSRHFIQSYFGSYAEDPIINSLYKEKEGDVDESEDPPEKNASNNGYLKAKQHLVDKSYDCIVNCCSNELANPLSHYKNESLLLRATMYIIRGESKNAHKDLDNLINLKDVPLKILVNALVKRGTLYMQMEQVEECLRDFEMAAKSDSLNSDIFHHKGQINLLLGNIDEAMADFKKAVDLNSKFPIAVVQKCYTYYRYARQQGDTARIEDLMKQFEDAITNFPKCVECYVLYAQALADQEEFDKADELYLKAIEVEPDNPTTLVHRALLALQSKGELAQAKKLMLQALEMDDQCELAYENLATIEIQIGNLKSGAELFEKAIPLAKTEMEMAHLYSLKNAAVAQMKVTERLGITFPNAGVC